MLNYPLLLLLLLTVAFALYIVYASIHEYQEQQRLLRHGASAEGVIVDVEERAAGESGVVHYPIVRFTTQEQVAVTALCPYSLTRSPIPYGELLPLHYQPDKPQHFILDEQAPGRSGIWISLLLAVVILGLCAKMVVEEWPLYS